MIPTLQPMGGWGNIRLVLLISCVIERAANTMTDVKNEAIEARVTAEQDRVLSRRTFLTRVMAITGCSAIGLLLDACGASTATAPTAAAVPTTATTSQSATTVATTATTSVATTATTATAGASPAGSPPAGGQGAPGGNESAALAEAFKGVTTDGNVIADLYPIKATGVSTDAVRTAAEAFLASLTEEQRASTLFTVDDDEWRKWSNVDGYTRQGISLEEMTDAQRSAALASADASALGLPRVMYRRPIWSSGCSRHLQPGWGDRAADWRALPHHDVSPARVLPASRLGTRVGCDDVVAGHSHQSHPRSARRLCADRDPGYIYDRSPQ